MASLGCWSRSHSGLHCPAGDPEEDHDDPDWCNSLYHTSVPQSAKRLSGFRAIQGETRRPNASTSSDTSLSKITRIRGLFIGS